MTNEEYKKERIARGSQRQVAAALGVHYEVISRRERGMTPIKREAELAILALPLRPTVPPASE